MSHEGTRIRQKFRQQIRSRQINEMMRMYRLRNMNGDKAQIVNIFRQMNDRILKSANKQFEMSMVQQILEIAEKYPEDENSYGLIGNYMIQHNCAYLYFAPKLLSFSDVAKKLQNYRWAISVMISLLKQTNNYLLNEYDQTMRSILQISETDEELSSCFKILNIILSLQNIQKQQKYLPQKFTRQFFTKITYCDMKLLRADTKYSIMQIMSTIGEYHLDNKVIRQYIPELVKILIEGIDEYPKFRQQFINCFKLIVYDNFQQVQQLFKKEIGAQILQILMYVFQQTNSLKYSILLIFEYFVRETKFQDFIFLLSKGLHVSLVSTFQFEDSDQLHKGLQVILQLFDRLSEKQQMNILNRVIDSMDQAHLVKHLQKLTEKRQDPKVEEVLKQLLDNYFSEEVA